MTRHESAYPHIIGRSIEGRDIVVYGAQPWQAGVAQENSTLIIGGVHGDEAATVLLLEGFLARHVGTRTLGSPTVVLPLANPDSYERRSRYNARGVDLNRNCGTNWSADSVEPPGPGPWSEPESRAMRDFILRWQPKKIVSLHWALAELDADGPQSTSLAQAMWDAMTEQEQRPYRLRVAELGKGQRRLEMTYSICPGSLGQWAGYGLTYPDGSRPGMITLELPYDPAAPGRPDALPDAHLDTLRDLWHREPEAYLHAVEPGVENMLFAACAWKETAAVQPT